MISSKTASTRSLGYKRMKRTWLLILLLAEAVFAQNVTKEKPCIAFSPESTSRTNALAKDPLEASVMLSGDFEFVATRHEGCWNVHVLSLPVITAKGKPMGYVISHTVTDPKSTEVGHALTFGPDRDIFVQAMRKAAADAIRNIRFTRSDLESLPRAHQPKQDAP
jgi:hypothetical protein